MTTPANPGEPRIWSHITDELPDDHPLTELPYVKCTQCDVMVHAGYNECMRTWVETGNGPYCLQCFAAHDQLEGLDDGWGLA